MQQNVVQNDSAMLCRGSNGHAEGWLSIVACWGIVCSHIMASPPPPELLWDADVECQPLPQRHRLHTCKVRTTSSSLTVP